MIQPKPLGLETVHRYAARILDRGKWGKENTFTHDEFSVLGENDRCLVINDLTFTTLHKDPKERLYSRINSPSIHVYVSDNLWGSGVWYTLYSASEVRAATIRAQIKAAINKKIGFFTSDVDLSIIADAHANQKESH